MFLKLLKSLRITARKERKTENKIPEWEARQGSNKEIGFSLNPGFTPLLVAL